MTLYLWLKALHIIFVVTWFAGLFYLPRLFIYHTSATDPISNARFQTMEGKLYRVIMNPSMIGALVMGIWLFAESWQAYSGPNLDMGESCPGHRPHSAITIIACVSSKLLLKTNNYTAKNFSEFSMNCPQLYSYLL